MKLTRLAIRLVKGTSHFDHRKKLSRSWILSFYRIS